MFNNFIFVCIISANNFDSLNLSAVIVAFMLGYEVVLTFNTEMLQSFCKNECASR